MSTYVSRSVNFEHIGFWVEKGTRAKYRSAAKTFGLTQSEMIRLAIDEYVANHSADTGVELNHGQPPLTGDEKHLLDEFRNLSPEAQKTLFKYLDSLQR